jgi:hypothetical protein
MQTLFQKRIPKIPKTKNHTRQSKSFQPTTKEAGKKDALSPELQPRACLKKKISKGKQSLQ